ncbi:MAG: endonuclease/exonuclease/phosphatase family protein [Patescibacteria group bacterium]
MDLKVLSWNILIDGDLEKWKEFLQQQNADIIGLQEVKDDDLERDVIGFLNKLGYEHTFARTEQIWDGKTYRHGSAIFSKFPIIHSEKIQLEKGDDERAAAYAQIDINGDVLHVFSAHLTHTHQQPSLEQEEEVRKLINRLPSKHVVVVGDFNAIPHSSSIQMMKKILVDTDPISVPTWSVHPEGCISCNPQEIDIKLDYIFVSSDLKTHSLSLASPKHQTTYQY